MSFFAVYSLNMIKMNKCTFERIDQSAALNLFLRAKGLIQPRISVRSSFCFFFVLVPFPTSLTSYQVHTATTPLRVWE